MSLDKMCLECGKPLVGRSDKKFCNSECRSAYYNNLNRNTNNLMRKVNRILRRNRRILAELNPNGKTKVHKRQMEKKKFDFTYFTNIYETQTGNIYYFCYDQGYLPLEKDFFALVERQEYV